MFFSIQENGIDFATMTSFAKGTPTRANVSARAYGISTDTRTAKQGDAFIALKGENFDGHRFLPAAEKAGCVFAVVDHEVTDCALPQIVVDDTTLALGRIAKAYKQCFRTISLAVTGSVGKTTTKEFIYAVLSRKYATNVTKGNFNNEIGLPLTLLGLTAEHKALLVEMGMNHKGEISALSAIAEPDISVITFIGTSHMENLGSREGIRDAKMEIVDGMRSGGILILNGDEPLLRDVVTDGICKIYVGLENESCTYKADRVRFLDDHILFDIRMHDGDIMTDLRINVLGKHNVMNALIACVCGILLGVPEDKIREGLLHFSPAAMRQSFIEKDGFTVIEDCYNACPESMKAGLEVLCHAADTRGMTPVAVLGDMKELGPVSDKAHLEVGAKVAAANVRRLITVGNAAHLIAAGARMAGMPEDRIVELDATASPEQNAAVIRSHIEKNDILLFKASRAMALERIAALL
ncbi:MAG: UDP-N-acetylmuramoyl-tripeptide--D-alanyl-D-alanine ligase [Clostridia bacterium]|nr:UDP-N-acetylmuramoyl-tripeptide--D-alanyl-D-alanine ligase [Clostridia bacterium]